MTKQEQIEQMARITCQMYCRQYEKRCAGVGECDYKCLHYQRCEALYDVGYSKKSEVIDEFVQRLLDAFPEGNRDARCPAIYYDDYKYIIEELAEKMKGDN